MKLLVLVLLSCYYAMIFTTTIPYNKIMSNIKLENSTEITDNKKNSVTKVRLHFVRHGETVANQKGILVSNVL